MRWPLIATLIGIGLAAIGQQGGGDWQHKAKSSAKQLAIGFLLYASDYDDVLPYPQNDETWQRVVYPYIKNRDVFQTGNPQKSKWTFNANLGGVNLVAADEPARTPLFRDSKAWPTGERLTGFVDGHVTALQGADLKASEKAWAKKYKRTAKKPLPADHFKKEAGF
ncbi:MAG: hypothetical protein HONBIEJF_01083 [Fimbriimonadaceae bacterium]|nr:hypothetical protein [Fimbriimonadaceae bacterium]